MEPGDKKYWEDKAREAKERADWIEREHWRTQESERLREVARQAEENAYRREQEEKKGNS